MLSRSSLGFGLILIVPLFGQSAKAPQFAVDDWSHHRLVFSNPSSLPNDQKNKIGSDLRYQMQRANRSATQRTLAATSELAGPMASLNASIGIPGASSNQKNKGTLKKDWSEAMGMGGASASASGSFSGRAGSGITLTITNGSNTLTLTAGTSNGTCSGTSPWTVDFNRGSNGNGNSSTWASGIAAVLGSTTQCSTDIGVTATANNPSNGDLTITAKSAGTAGNGISLLWGSGSNFSTWSNTTDLAGGTESEVQPNAYPAKFSFGTATASCSDFVVYPTGQAGATNAANIIAYGNLYVGGCTGTVPSVYWAFNTGAYSVTTSPIISYDNTGSQIAFIQSNGTTAELVLLKWKASDGTLTSPVAPTNETTSGVSAYRSCTTPCMYTFGLGADDTYSSPFYDYRDDAIYVGDDSGRLHKITGVFNNPTTIAETSPFPVALGSSKISSPVYDFSSGNVLVGDMGGIFYDVSSSGTKNGNTGVIGDVIADAPLVDGTTGQVFVFTTSAVTGVFTGGNVVFQFGHAFTSYTGAGSVYLGTGGAEHYIYAGAFDNVYFASSNGTGNIYVVGNSGTAGGATLYQVPISAGSLEGGGGTARVTGLTSSDAYGWASPATEFCNGTCAVSSGATTSGTDYLFFSVNSGAVTGCTSGAGHACILSYKINSPVTVAESGSGLSITSSGANGCWATGGISIDNSATSSGASQIYLVNLNGNAAGDGTAPASSSCTGGTAQTVDGVQAAQSGP